MPGQLSLPQMMALCTLRTEKNQGQPNPIGLLSTKGIITTKSNWKNNNVAYYQHHCFDAFSISTFLRSACWAMPLARAW